VRGFSVFQYLANPRQDTVHVLVHFVVPETQNAITLCFQPCASLSIPFALNRLGVLTSIELDDQLPVEAREVDDEGAARHLATELMLFKLAIAQAGPKLLLCHGLVASETAGGCR
jgi:hypothetical protein